MPLGQRKTDWEQPAVPDMPPRAGSSPGWRQKISRLLLIIICAEVGIVLLVYPWLDVWGQNYLSGGTARWYGFWMNSYFRGAISGLGAVNLYISLQELLRYFFSYSKL